jgi:cold shock CspA family protein
MNLEIEPHIDFQGLEATDQLRQAIAQNIARIEKRFGRLTGCRVVIKAPGERHRQGGLYEVNIWLTLPGGREVNVDRTPNADERHSSASFALHDAFKRAGRQLQDEVRRMQGHVKEHAEALIGTVAKLHPAEGFGFLTTADGSEIYFHRNSVLDGAFDRLEVGTRVSFAEEMGEKGPQASTVKLLGKHGLR